MLSPSWIIAYLIFLCFFPYGKCVFTDNWFFSILYLHCHRRFITNALCSIYCTLTRYLAPRFSDSGGYMILFSWYIYLVLWFHNNWLNSRTSRVHAGAISVQNSASQKKRSRRVACFQRFRIHFSSSHILLDDNIWPTIFKVTIYVQIRNIALVVVKYPCAHE